MKGVSLFVNTYTCFRYDYNMIYSLSFEREKIFTFIMLLVAVAVGLVPVVA